MTATPFVSASEHFKRAVATVREHKLDAIERKPAYALPSAPPRPSAHGEGPVGGLVGDLWDMSSRLRQGSASVSEIVEASRIKHAQDA